MPVSLPTTRRVVLYYLLGGYSLFVAGCKPVDPDPLRELTADQTAVVETLNKVIYPLRDADPTRDFSELAPLDTVLAKAQVVGMGEGTHGTREFFQMKDRLFRYLVQKHGHQAFGFEANFGRAVLVNRFIHGQNTNLTSAADAAKSMYFWTWSTREVQQLLQWMKAYNATQSTSQQINFYGFDCQYADDEFPLVSEFLAKADPSLLAQVDSLSTLYTLSSQASATDLLRQQYARRLPDLYALFLTNETQWAAAGGREDYEIARQAARVLIQQQDLSNGEGCKRDQYMAENVQWLLTRMHLSKLSLWAHNRHVGNLPSYNCGLPSMGSYLKQQLKDQYLIIGTSLTNGSFTVRNAALDDSPLTTLSVHTDALKSSFNYLLGKGQYANFVLKLNQLQSGAALVDWLTTTHPLFETGSGYDESRSENYYDITPLTGRYDILFHFRDTSPTQLLP